MSVLKLEIPASPPSPTRTAAGPGNGISKASIAAARRKAREVGRDVYLVDRTGPRGTGSLMLRVSSSSELFYLRYMQAGSRSWQPVGPYCETSTPGHFTLAEARHVALVEAAKRRSNAMGDLASTPASDTRISAAHHSSIAQSAASYVPSPSSPVCAESSAPTLSQLCAFYVDALRRRGAQSARNVESLFKHITSSDLGKHPAHIVTAGQIVEILRPLIETDRGPTAENLRRNLKTAFTHVMKKRNSATRPAAAPSFPLVVYNPVADVEEMPEFNRARERDLNAHELREVVASLRRLTLGDESVESLSARAVLVSLYLGGQRGMQLLAARLAELDLDNPVVATILLRDAKGRRDKPRLHLLPLEGPALEMVRWFAQRSREVGSPWLFASMNTDLQLSQGYLSRRIKEISRAVADEPWCRGPFQYRDLRRTVETMLASIDIDDKSRGHVLSHGLGGVQDTVYNKWEYMPQKRRTLNAWHDMLRQICDNASSGEPSS